MCDARDCLRCTPGRRTLTVVSHVKKAKSILPGAFHKVKTTWTMWISMWISGFFDMYFCDENASEGPLWIKKTRFFVKTMKMKTSIKKD
jgi:hypothetical protein